jgi:hypothetical protein
MRMKNIERRGPKAESCAVCGCNDVRMLATTRLDDGSRVTVCGSHKIAHRRQERLASSVAELVSMIGERRKIAV